MKAERARQVMLESKGMQYIFSQIREAAEKGNLSTYLYGEKAITTDQMLLLRSMGYTVYCDYSTWTISWKKEV